MVVRLTEAGQGGQETKVHYVDSIYKFAILGGSKRSFTSFGEDKGDAEVMSEFYQAKQFHNLIISKGFGFDTFMFQKIYDKHLSFEFTFMVSNVNPDARFRILQLDAKRARIIKPPAGDGAGETLNIKYSSPQVIYWYKDALGTRNEKL
jgi:hypothetical protein